MRSTVLRRPAVTATTRHATGVHHLSGVSYLIGKATFTYTDGRASTIGGAWTTGVRVVLRAGRVLAGRLWRLLPQTAPPAADVRFGLYRSGRP